MAHSILVVDDDDDLRGIISMRLRAAGYDVEEADNGEEAIKRLETLRPDVILLDIMMPVMDGFETCQKIRNIREISEIPVIFLTARSEDWDMLTGYSKGCDSYLIKPVDFDVLQKEITKILS